MSTPFDDERLSEALDQNNDLRRLVADLRNQLAQAQADVVKSKELCADLVQIASRIAEGLEKLKNL